MDPKAKSFLYQLLTTASPSGHEQEIQRLVRKEMKPYADSIETDLHGNVIVAINPKAKRRVMLAGHCDQIGYMVKHISKDGYIYLAPLGGIDAGVLPGSLITIYAKSGQITAVAGRKPIHYQTSDERDRVKIDLDKMWVDIGAASRAEVEKHIRIGDYATYKLGVTELANNLISSPGLDNRAGLFVAMQTLKLCRKAKLTSVGVYAVSTVQEEIGLRGARTSAYRVDPEVGIAIDVRDTTDSPSAEGSKLSPCLMGKGPAISVGPNSNPVVVDLLERAAKKGKIAYQRTPDFRPLGTDANAIQLNRSGVATVNLGIPNRYMHTQVEVCSLKDLEAAPRLLLEFIRGIGPKTDFRPL